MGERPASKYLLKSLLAILGAVIIEPLISNSEAFGMMIGKITWKYFPLGRGIVIFIFFIILYWLFGRIRALKTQ